MTVYLLASPQGRRHPSLVESARCRSGTARGHGLAPPLQGGFVQLGHELLGCGPAPALLDELGDFIPVLIDVEADADPPVLAGVPGNEEAARVGRDERLLYAR